MKRQAFSQRVVADIIFRAREPGQDDHRDAVQFQMPTALLRLFQAEARRRGVDFTTCIRDVLCEALTDRAEAIRRLNHQRERHGSVDQ
jgi:hypothetical protein